MCRWCMTSLTYCMMSQIVSHASLTTAASSSVTHSRDNCYKSQVQQQWLMSWLHVKCNYFEIFLKQFQRFISHATADGGYMWNKTLRVKQNTEIISKLFLCFISHVSTSKIISKLFQQHSICWIIFMSCNKPLKLCWNNFRQNHFSRDIEEGWNNYEIILFHM